MDIVGLVKVTTRIVRLREVQSEKLSQLREACTLVEAERAFQAYLKAEARLNKSHCKLRTFLT